MEGTLAELERLSAENHTRTSTSTSFGATGQQLAFDSVCVGVSVGRVNVLSAKRLDEVRVHRGELFDRP
jgi:hypothetical protein